MKEKCGIIDIGSNTMKLVMYERNQSGRLKEIENVNAPVLNATSNRSIFSPPF
ncbi:hypothetical protein [Parageobacillus thermoglucosidasius]|uniref:Exopolyphosphatase n=1 Tax=Geobacillus sp. (strain Y4.1MC1) TaxID=581103 RepID=A0A7U3YFV4_GEOS0|nr:hypothetical protein [Parageobacillus thermoglucosidasius]AEH48297.1 hypothetical protein Geoth_2373 [Parageobacillus thermoglucosidasius C56-YS93]BDG32493.1 hypothetical protein PthBH41_22050 [Parageobacillus thermoglucosidasius]GMN99353.1 hypothetical protein PthstB1num2_13930 [Parageobacillus thermoglucosidasius]